MQTGRPLIALTCVLLVCLAGALIMAPKGIGDLPGSTVKVLAENGHGSGVHVGHGYIITAAHVVLDKPARIKLDDGSVQEAETLWVNSDYDLALLKTPETMHASALDCRVPGIGEVIRASGNPGLLEFVSSEGKIAGAERNLGKWKRALPTDMTIVMGMSGGPVFAQDGRVIGISVGVMVAALGGMYPTLTGFGFIVPSAALCDLMAWRAIA